MQNIIFLFLIQIKHFLADFIIQNDQIAKNKGKNFYYLALHSSHHAILSFFILIFFSNLYTAIFLAIYEIFTHSFFDFIKANNKLLGRYTYPSKLYFVFFGLDQMLHQLNYIIFLFILNL